MMITFSSEPARFKAVLYFMRIYILTFVIIALSAVSHAQGMEKLDRRTALQSALQNNPSYLASMQDSRSAKYSYFSSWSEFLPSADASYSNSRTKREDMDHSDSESVVLSAELNVFRGFRSYNSMRSSKLSMENMEETEKETLLKTISDVNLAYRDALRANYLRKNGRTLYESAKLVLEEAEVRQQLDFITRADLYNARADKERAYYSLLDAENNYFTAILELNRLTGLDIDINTELTPDERVFKLQEFEYYLQLVESRNTTLRKSYLDREIAQRRYNSSYGTFLPSVSLSASTGWYDNDIEDYESNRIGISANWNLFSGMGDTFTLIANAKSLNSAELNMSASRDRIMKDLKVAYQKAVISFEKSASAELYLQAAEENYTATQEMFRLGRVSLKDTVDARATLEDAQASVADADYSMAQAFEELTVLTGTINIE